MTWALDTAGRRRRAVLRTGFLVPALIARLPEPVTPDEEVDEADTSTPEHLTEPRPRSSRRTTSSEEPKELYADIAALPGLGWKCALAAGVVGALVGGKVGWEWELLFLVYLVPVGVALAVVDWRTRLLPTRVIAPSYVVVDRARRPRRAPLRRLPRPGARRLGLGGRRRHASFAAVAGSTPAAMGYGDVRLSGLLGIALGYLGWGELAGGRLRRLPPRRARAACC